jgi:hypothetical protein
MGRQIGKSLGGSHAALPVWRRPVYNTRRVESYPIPAREVRFVTNGALQAQIVVLDGIAIVPA